ncbi:PQQ-binding-like beta-propeller repeat protein [Archangium violaceum]|uniref:outer membrane protein assembly factor BamB family protein n=1 Tax=Archangium violaceum TaxID=83451 RepID=UPI00194FF9BB|nr:PQQ-binding-like beta-propeller repeat protein [Archangium violaceum]QRN95125.1 PQQ-binding-like beta-propeller repeat protein [Archangium violaceum]
MPPRLPQRLLLPLAVVALMAACRQPADRLFATSTDAPSRSGLLPLGDGVLVGNEAGRLLRLDRQGETVWRVELGREVAARPSVSGDSILVGTVGGTLVSLTLAQGTERWRLTGQPPMLTSLVSDANAVYVVAPDGTVRAHAVDSGAVRWRHPLPSGAPRPDATRPLPSPVLFQGLVVVALGEAGLFALSAEDGAVRWRQPLSQVLGMEAQGEVLYVSTRKGEVLALGLADGQVRWRRTLAAALSSPPSLARGQVWVGTEDNLLLALAPGDGREVSRLALPAPLVTQVTGFRDWVLVPTRGNQGWLLALEPAKGPPIFSLRLDTPLLSPPVVLGDQLFVLGHDGRVLSWRLQPPKS